MKKSISALEKLARTNIAEFESGVCQLVCSGNPGVFEESVLFEVGEILARVYGRDSVPYAQIFLYWRPNFINRNYFQDRAGIYRRAIQIFEQHALSDIPLKSSYPSLCSSFSYELESVCHYEEAAIVALKGIAGLAKLSSNREEHSIKSDLNELLGALHSALVGNGDKKQAMTCELWSEAIRVGRVSVREFLAGNTSMTERPPKPEDDPRVQHYLETTKGITDKLALSLAIACARKATG